MNFSKKKKKIIDPLELEKEVLFSLRPITSAVEKYDKIKQKYENSLYTSTNSNKSPLFSQIVTTIFEKQQQQPSGFLKTETSSKKITAKTLNFLKFQENSYRDSFKNSLRKLEEDVSLTITEAMKDFSYLDNVKNSGIKKLAGLEFENRRSLKVIDEKNQSNFFIPKINRTTDSLIKNRTYDKLDNISKKENCSIDMRKIENKKSNNNSEITKPLLNSRFHFNTPQYTIFDRNQIKKTQIDLFNAWKNQTLKTTNYKKKINSMNKILKNTIKKDERFFFDKRELQKPSIILGVLTLHDGFPKRVENLAKYQSQKKHFYLEQITEEGNKYSDSQTKIIENIKEIKNFNSFFSKLENN